MQLQHLGSFLSNIWLGDVVWVNLARALVACIRGRANGGDYISRPGLVEQRDESIRDDTYQYHTIVLLRRTHRSSLARAVVGVEAVEWGSRRPPRLVIGLALFIAAATSKFAPGPFSILIPTTNSSLHRTPSTSQAHLHVLLQDPPSCCCDPVASFSKLHLSPPQP